MTLSLRLGLHVARDMQSRFRRPLLVSASQDISPSFRASLSPVSAFARRGRLAAARSMLVVAALLLAGCGGGGGGGDGGDGSGGGSGGAETTPSTASQSCPLTDQQTQNSVAAWKKIAGFLTTEPRCVNCHGGVNPYIDGVGVDTTPDSDGSLRAVSQVEHGGGQIDRPATGKDSDAGCVDCHDDMVGTPDRPGVWGLALASHAFLNKDATTLCRQIKRATGTASHFLAHMVNDGGVGPDFVNTAFLGNRGLKNPGKLLPPSIEHPQFLQMGNDWIDAMGGQFQGDDSCGCEPRHSGWSGQIHAAVQTDVKRARDPGVATGFALSTVTITVADGKGTYNGEATLNYQDPVASWDGGPITEATQASGTATVPVELQVDVDTAGNYNIRLTFPSGDIESLVIGAKTDTYCSTRYGTCNTQNQPVLMPPPPSSMGAPADPFIGKLTDADHIQGSQTWTTGTEDSSFGRAQNIITLNLWRAPPP
jgi:hypothetical protein